MSTVAFIGGDGSGKSTIASMMLKNFPQRTKLLYMGMSTRSNSRALPTSRLMHFLKTALYKRKKSRPDKSDSEILRLYYEENRCVDKRGKVGATARLLNRWAEEWFRQLISWYYQLRGYLVIYDRHFLFDFAPVAWPLKEPSADRLTEKLHRWTLSKLYPKPKMTLFLDAPPEVLIARKGEATLDYLKTKRNAYLQQGHKTANFFTIDATQPVERVYNEVVSLIQQYFDSSIESVKINGAVMKRQTRVAMIVFSSYPSDARVRREAETLRECGAQVDVICCRKNGQKAKETIRGVNVHRLRVSKKRSGQLRYIGEYAAFVIGSFFKLNQIYLKSFHNVVHVHNMPEILVFSAVIQRLLGAKIVLDMHDPTPEVYMTKYNIKITHRAIRLLAFLEQISIKFAHLVITPNKAFRDRFIERGCPAGKIEIVMNTPKDNIFKAELSKKEDESQPKNRCFEIMYHGTIVERHGLGTALKAVTLLRDKIPNVTFNVYGDGDYAIQFKKLIEELELQEIVRYHGFISNEEIARAITRIDVGIIPNLRSPFTEINLPVRIFEYLCLKKPVIVPRTSGILDYFDSDSINFFKPGDTESLANTIFKIYKKPSEQQKILEKGFEIYQKYSWESQGRQFINYVKKLTNPTPVTFRNQKSGKKNPGSVPNALQE